MTNEKTFFYISLALLCMVFVLGACSSNNNNENNNNEVVDNDVPNNHENEDNLVDENNDNEENNDLEEDTNDGNNEDENADSGEEVESQTELSFGETGTVITGDNAENYRVEVTPESVEYTNEYEDEHGKAEPWEEIFVKYTATIKNTDDKPFPISKIRIPSLATWENETDDFTNLDHQQAAFDEEIYLDGKEVTPEDEIAPGEEITVISIFDTDEVDKYYLQYGQGGEQIVTYAQWTIEASDFK